jgi:hypothetical protein
MSATKAKNDDYQDDECRCRHSYANDDIFRVDYQPAFGIV